MRIERIKLPVLEEIRELLPSPEAADEAKTRYDKLKNSGGSPKIFLVQGYFFVVGEYTSIEQVRETVEDMRNDQ